LVFKEEKDGKKRRKEIEEKRDGRRERGTPGMQV
jgi:hypothetical protein